jgi:hypothetical protein
MWGETRRNRIEKRRENGYATVTLAGALLYERMLKQNSRWNNDGGCADPINWNRGDRNGQSWRDWRYHLRWWWWCGRQRPARNGTIYCLNLALEIGRADQLRVSVENIDANLEDLFFLIAAAILTGIPLRYNAINKHAVT